MQLSKSTETWPLILEGKSTTRVSKSPFKNQKYRKKKKSQKISDKNGEKIIIEEKIH